MKTIKSKNRSQNDIRKGKVERGWRGRGGEGEGERERERGRERERERKGERGGGRTFSASEWVVESACSDGDDARLCRVKDFLHILQIRDFLKQTVSNGKRK